jgi:hypothetical protein
VTIALVVWCLLVASPILIWLVFRGQGYKRQALDAPPGPDWQKTGERFIDPRSGETLDVWYCARSGERAYVRASGNAQSARDA